MTEESHPLESFGAWALYERSGTGRSRVDVGRDIGVSEEMVRLIETGKRNPSPDVAIRFANTFSFNPWQLLAYFGILDHDTLMILAATPPPDEMPAPGGA